MHWTLLRSQSVDRAFCGGGAAWSVRYRTQRAARGPV